MATNLDPQLLQQLLALTQTQGGRTNDAMQWVGPDGYTVDRRPVYQQTGTGESTEWAPTQDMRTLIYGPQSGGTWSYQQNDVWDDQGQYQGTSGGDSTALSLAKLIATAVGGYYGTEYLNGLEAAGAGAGAGANAGGWDAATNAAMDQAMIDAAASGSIAPGAGAGTLATGASTGAQALNAANKVATTGGAVNDLLKTAAPYVGAVAGALDNKDREQTQSVEPWAPSRPYLEGLLREGAGLFQNLKDQPFSRAQQAAYGNAGGLLDIINSNAPGLLAGANAMASGANQFRRGQQTQLQGSQPFSFWGTPNLLGDFGTGGK